MVVAAAAAAAAAVDRIVQTQKEFYDLNCSFVFSYAANLTLPATIPRYTHENDDF